MRDRQIEKCIFERLQNHDTQLLANAMRKVMNASGWIELAEMGVIDVAVTLTDDEIAACMRAVKVP